ncbi:unnamed protein product [Microthlaspi erraticum]|uniref:Uncharacterized protein n=1 Tax=Microthlaspi erraticum TaxID=1685480 RepID=A0A6D2JVX3_9BRAS|nr:unnamed protein product [Microthlaspi erraticum]
MASFVSENVAAEKVDAMRRFKEKRKFWKFLPAIEALVVVLLLLSWLTPTVSTGEYLRQIVSTGFTGEIFLFSVVNVLIALIFSLSNHHKLSEPDLYFEYVSSYSSASLGGCSSADAPGGCSSSAVVSKSSGSYHNEVKTSEVKLETDFTSGTGEARPRREMVRAISSVAETAHATIRRKREMMFVPLATSESATDRLVYRRSRSERLDLRGDIRRNIRRLSDIDDLSSDEFRSTVETFIAGKKKMLLKEWMKP